MRRSSGDARNSGPCALNLLWVSIARTRGIVGPSCLPSWIPVWRMCVVRIISLVTTYRSWAKSFWDCKEKSKLVITDFSRQRVISAWNKLDLHDCSIQQISSSLYLARWGNALFVHTNGSSESSFVQKLKFSVTQLPTWLTPERTDWCTA